MPIFCPNCGKENQDAAKVCFSCGTPLAGEGPESLLGRVAFGAYELVELIGEGGMAAVYKGRHQLTGQVVAVKMLPPELAVYPEVRARFVDEARTLARLEHPNIVHLITFAEDLGRMSLVMQYAEGQTLEDILDESGRITAVELVRITREVLAALEHAHSQGVVHRDIKPSNIIVRPDRSVKVTDFGIAKITRDTKLTQTGQTMGTVRYMSPEQVQGSDVDGRSDLYSLAVSMYEAVVGHTPFDGETHFAIMSQHLSATPKSPLEVGARVSEALNAVIMKGLSKKPEDRYADAKEMARALERCPEAKTTRDASRLTGAQRASGTGSRKKLWVVVAVGVLAAVLAAVGVFLLPGGDHSESGSQAAGHQAKHPAARSTTKTAVQVELERWKTQMHPKLQAVSKKVSWVVQAERNETPYVRVWSDVKVDADGVEKLYLSSIDRYRALLGAERISGSVEPRPLVIVLLDSKNFVDKAFWGPQADADVRYYPLPVATLFIPLTGSTFDRSALLFGVASHLCPARLPASKCQSLANRFETFVQQRGNR